ncbi:unnamed protein product, partial [Meganyctiphanes norvegica]
VVNGMWSSWSPWSTCSADCRENRSRDCKAPPPSNGGRDCSGDRMISKQCTGGICISSSNSIIIASVTSIICIVTLLTVITFCIKKQKNKEQQELPFSDMTLQQSGPGMGIRHDSENSLYGAVSGTSEPQVPNSGSQHVSENSLYGAAIARDA